MVSLVLAEVNPRMFSSLRVADVVEKLGAVLSGREDLVTALNGLKQQANFRVVGDLPVGPLLSLLGVKLDSAHPVPGADAGLAAQTENGAENEMYQRLSRPGPAKMLRSNRSTSCGSFTERRSRCSTARTRTETAFWTRMKMMEISRFRWIMRMVVSSLELSPASRSTADS